MEQSTEAIRKELVKLGAMMKEREGHALYNQGWAAGAHWALCWMVGLGNLYRPPSEMWREQSAPKGPDKRRRSK